MKQKEQECWPSASTSRSVSAESQELVSFRGKIIVWISSKPLGKTWLKHGHFLPWSCDWMKDLNFDVVEISPFVTLCTELHQHCGKMVSTNSVVILITFDPSLSSLNLPLQHHETVFLVQSLKLFLMMIKNWNIFLFQEMLIVPGRTECIQESCPMNVMSSTRVSMVWAARPSAPRVSTTLRRRESVSGLETRVTQDVACILTRSQRTSGDERSQTLSQPRLARMMLPRHWPMDSSVPEASLESIWSWLTPPVVVVTTSVWME